MTGRPMLLDAATRRVIYAWAAVATNKSQLARKLGISSSALDRYLKRMNKGQRNDRPA